MVKRSSTFTNPADSFCLLYECHVEMKTQCVHVEYGRSICVTKPLYIESFVTLKHSDRYQPGTAEHKRANTWLADGWCGVLFALTGDLDYLHGMLGCPNASLVSGPCVWCQCTGTGENTWCDFRQGGPWRMTRWSPQEWRLWENRNRLSLLTLPGASCWTIHYDWLHCKYLGMDQYIFGSVMAVLVNYVMPQSAEQNLQTAWAYLRQFFKDNQTPTPFRYMNRLSMFLRAAGKFPKLRGKGSEIRHFGKALLSLWSKEMNVHLSLRKKILLMLQLNVELEDTITEFKEEFSFPPGIAQRFEEACSQMLLLLTQIAEHYLQEDIKYFDITSKCHMVQELAIMSKCISPRVVWVFAGEDQMQKMQSIAQTCTRGNKVPQQSVKLCRHYRLALHFLFEEQCVGL